MIAFCGQTRSAELIAELEDLGIGECTQRGELPPRRPLWFHDCNAYADWRAGAVFNGVRWSRDQRIIETRESRGIPAPLFGVVPDVVADAAATFAMSARERPWMAPGVPAYFVVQNGMTPDEVGRWLDAQPDDYHGIFVGGDLPWKLATASAWVAFAHARGMQLHIGRCGPPARVRWAREIGADSIDSSLPLRARHHMDRFLDALGTPRASSRRAA